jgi:superfamily II DNA helicase RecQ
LNEAGQFISSLDRANIRYRVHLAHLEENGEHRLVDYIMREHATKTGIVHRRTRKDHFNTVEEVRLS